LVLVPQAADELGGGVDFLVKLWAEKNRGQEPDILTALVGKSVPGPFS
jgi:hypothetical protein